MNRTSENLAGITHRTVLAAVCPGARLVIGDNVGMSGVVLYCTTAITIEDNVGLGLGTRVYDTDFHAIDWMARRVGDAESIPKEPVRICRDVWVGANVSILKGVTIGARSAIGAGAVVTHDVPPDTIVAGVPARIVRHLEHQDTGDDC